MKEKLRMEIVKTAKLLLQEGKDIRHITMNLIAKKMGITAPTLYHYFKGKEEIIFLSLELIADELLDTFETPLPVSMPAEMKLKMRIVTLMSYLYKNLNSFSLIFTDSGIAYLGGGDIPLSEKVARFKERLEEQVKMWLTNEKVKYDSVKATYLLLSLMMGILRYYKEKDTKDADISTEAEVVFDFFKNGLKGHK